MVKARVFLFNETFDGFPKESNFKLVEEELPALKDGEFLAEAQYLSVDPYMRAYTPLLKIGRPMIGGQVARIIESKNPQYPVGTNITGQFGWRDYTISDGTPDPKLRFPVMKLPDFEQLPLSLGVGVLGMPGNTAYFGFLELCKPKAGETVIVTGAAGAVGNHVGQIAKIRGCKVIGVAGSDTKGKWLTDELKFDHFINYKTANIDASLRECAPNGIDCYFDNVGGEISTVIMNRMNHFGRISVCGAISGYNDRSPKASIVQYPLVMKELKMEGFVVNRWLNPIEKYMEGIQQNKQWLNEGKLQYRETVTDGFENMFKAFTDMLKGVNVGKAVVRAKALVK